MSDEDFSAFLEEEGTNLPPDFSLEDVENYQIPPLEEEAIEADYREQLDALIQGSVNFLKFN